MITDLLQEICSSRLTKLLLLMLNFEAGHFDFPSRGL